MRILGREKGKSGDGADQKPLLPVRRPRLGLALGGGGARGLAHVVVLEAFDDLGVKPDVISGTSIGAIYGSAYAAGLSANMIRAHTEEALSQRFDLVRQVLNARPDPVSWLLKFLPIRPALLDPVALLNALLPSGMPGTLQALNIPLRIVACDFYSQTQVVITHGDLKQAVAASMTLPVLFAPVKVGGRAMVDGGFVNPLPFDILSDAADLTVAIDVSGGVPPDQNDAPTPPSSLDVLSASSQILQRSIVREKLKSLQPDVLVECPVGEFSVIDFHRWKEVLRAAEPVRDQVKRQVDRLLRSETISHD
ncbi:MAG TPA: patatin-like phospholipase family protein [Hyphomicrobiaceae bacterium]|nr:patatin-like phospholipase family protein [Hyphomicrobiaceae bacterium]